MSWGIWSSASDSEELVGEAGGEFGMEVGEASDRRWGDMMESLVACES